MTYYNANVGPTGANQPLSFNPQAVASSTGGATFSFPAVPNGQIWTGTVTVIGAPDSATMTISSIHLGNDIGQFIGGNNWGPLQLQSGDQPIVTATGLVPGTTYVCNFQGTGITGGDPGITYPEAYAHSVTSRTEQIVLASGSTVITRSTGTSNLTIASSIPVQASYRSYYVILWVTGLTSGDFTTLEAFALGNQSSQPYAGILTPYNGNAYKNLISETKIISYTGVDTTLTFLATAAGTGLSTFTLNWVIGADLTPFDVAMLSSWPSVNSNPTITNYGGLPVENIQYKTGTGLYSLEPLIVAGISGGYPISITPATVTPATSSSSGTTASSLIAVKTSAGTIYGIYLFNGSTTANTYLQIWNLATGSITIGTTAPLYSFGVPYGGGAYIPFPEPLALSTAITIAATTTRAGSTYATTGLDYDIIYV